MAKRVLVALAAAPAALAACHSSDDPVVTEITKVTGAGFTSPGDAVASPDGKTFYFTAFSDTANDDGVRLPGIYRVANAPDSAAEVIASGDPLRAPMGLVLSCDGGTLYAGDLGNETAAVYSIGTAGGGLTDLAASGLVHPSGLAMGPDCETLFITARTEDGRPGLFKMARAGGPASLVFAGDPLVSPTGLHVDSDGVAWVMDHLAYGARGEGVLFAIPSDGSAANEVVSDLKMGMPGGVSLNSAGTTAVMPTVDRDGKGQLTTVNLKSGELVQIAAPDMIEPAGLRTSRDTAVFAVVDSEGGAIYSAK
jgi:sugar lactone lactonase YvrE